jgi:hypothetical protein
MRRRARADSATFCDLDLPVSDRVLTLAAVTNFDAANVMTANSNNLQKLLALADIEPLTLLKTIQN